MNPRRATCAALMAIAPCIGGCDVDDDYYYDDYYYDTYAVYTYDDLVYDTMTIGYPYYGYYDYYYWYSSPVAQEGGDGSSLPTPLRALLGAFGVSVPEGCVTPGSSSADEDEDGIPASYSANLACTAEDGATASGTVEVADADDGAEGSGFTLTFSPLTLTSPTSRGGSRARTLDGTLAVSQRSDPPAYEIERDITVDFNDVRANGNAVQGTYVTNARSSYTPDEGAGDPLDAGTLTVSGETEVTLNGDNGGTTRTITRSTDPPLHWSRSCLEDDEGMGIDAGTLVLRDDVENTLRVEFSGCGRPSLDYEPGEDSD